MPLWNVTALAHDIQTRAYRNEAMTFGVRLTDAKMAAIGNCCNESNSVAETKID